MSQAVRFHASSLGNRQQGISLLMVLILLVVMSVLGIAVLRSSAMQERMTANLRDRNDAFQAAETGLRAAQNDVIGNSDAATYNDMWDGTKTFAKARTDARETCADNGVCDKSDPDRSKWETPPTDLDNWVDVTDGSKYRYTVEYLGTGKGSNVLGLCETSPAKDGYQCQRPMFRVTSYGRGKGVAQVVLQAMIVNRGNVN